MPASGTAATASNSKDEGVSHGGKILITRWRRQGMAAVHGGSGEARRRCGGGRWPAANLGASAPNFFFRVLNFCNRLATAIYGRKNKQIINVQFFHNIATI